MAYSKRSSFASDEHADEVRKELLEIASNVAFHTNSTYSADAELYPDNLIPFVDKHMRYLSSHPGIDPNQYLANLRLMTRRR